MTVAIESVLKTVNQFVTKTRGAPKKPIAAETQLFKEGYLDSFGLVDLIADLESNLSIPLGAGTLIPEDFESPKVLWGRLNEL